MRPHLFALLSVSFLFWTAPADLYGQNPGNSAFLDSLIATRSAAVESLRNLGAEASLSIIYSRIDRAPNGMPLITDIEWHSDSLRFYSSEAVHLPLAALSLQKMAGYRSKGVDRNTTMIIEAGTDEQMPAYNDPRWPGGRPSLERYLTDLLLLHEPGSFDRVYEFLGQEYILREFSGKRYSIRYLCRLEPESDEACRRTNPVIFFDESMRPLHRQEMAYYPDPYPPFSGEGSFAEKNLLHIKSLHHLFTSVIYPERVSASERLEISEDDRQFLLINMSRLPAETVFPYHDPATLNENAFFAAILPDKPGVRLFNTGGISSNTVIESVFVTDTTHAVEFMLTAAIKLTDSSRMDQALDFLSLLGDLLYDHERGRVRQVKPDLSPFILRYDN